MSVRGERVVYREREREVDYEEPQKRTYTTVKRYQVPDRDNRSSIHDSDDIKEEKITIRRERREEGGSGHGPKSEIGSRLDRFSDRDRDYGRRDDRREEVDVKISERYTERERERDRDSDRRDVSYRVLERERERESDRDRDRFSGNGRTETRIIEREREISRAPSPPIEERMREFRFERERDYSPARAAREDRPYDLERYSKSTEYYQPQPIIIREPAPQPIIIREERREPQQIIIRREEPHYEFVEREEIREDRQLVRHEEPPPPATTARSVVKSSVHPHAQQEEEDYFYERRIREVDRVPRRRREEEIRPSDSASQYSSDDSYEYVRRERYTEGERDRSPNHRLHLAEGAIAGAGAAEIFRQHRKSQGRDSAHRGRDLIGGAALGAIAAEGISRAKSMRATSRKRSWDEDDRKSRRGGRARSRPRSRSRSRSRSQSKSRAKQLGGLAAVAAVGALAGYALKKGGQNKETVIINDGPHRHRSRSRRRRGSFDTIDDVSRTDTAQNSDHRNRRIAQAGLASAAAAGIFERFRSKSRGGRERSKSRVRTAAPIIGAGLGGAALAGLYERNKANKDATRDAIIEDERNRGRRRSSRSRSRSVAALEDRRRMEERDMVAYGHDPIHPDGQRPRDYYSDEEPGMYRRRHRDGSAGSSPDTRRRSRSRGRGLAEAGLAAAAGAAAGHEVGRSRSRRRLEDDRHRHEYDDYDRHGYITPPPNEPAYANQAYPTSNYFPPPPNAETAYHEGAAAPAQEAFNPYPPYNPAEYNPPATAGAAREAYQDPTVAEAAAARERQVEREEHRGRDAGNVSSPIANVDRPGTNSDIWTSSPPPSLNNAQERVAADPRHRADGIESSSIGDQQHQRVDSHRDGSITPRARSTSRVRFDLNSTVAHSPDDLRRHHPSTTTDSSAQNENESFDEDAKRGRRPRSHRHRGSSALMNDPHERAHDSDSDETIDLPPRFDQHGNRKNEVAGTDLATQLTAFFGGIHNQDDHGRRDGGRSRHSAGNDDAGAGGDLGALLRGIAGEIFQNNDGRHEDDRTARRSRR